MGFLPYGTLFPCQAIVDFSKPPRSIYIFHPLHFHVLSTCPVETRIKDREEEIAHHNVNDFKTFSGCVALKLEKPSL